MSHNAPTEEVRIYEWVYDLVICSAQTAPVDATDQLLRVAAVAGLYFTGWNVGIGDGNVSGPARETT